MRSSSEQSNLGYVLIGFAVPLLLARTWRGRLLAWAAMLPTVALGALGFAVFVTLYEQLASVV